MTLKALQSSSAEKGLIKVIAKEEAGLGNGGAVQEDSGCEGIMVQVCPLLSTG